MNKVIKKCEKCGNIAVYTPDYKLHKKNNCMGNLIQTNISYEEFCTMCDILDENSFYEAMIELKEKDIIEYNLKMSQFRTQIEQQKADIIRRGRNTSPQCPNCHSTMIRKIDALERAGSVAMLGIFSKKINKSFKCQKCGYTW